MNEKITIRQATVEDIDEISSLWLEFMGEVYPAEKPSVAMFMSQLRLLMAAPSYVMFVVEAGGKIVGYEDGYLSESPFFGGLIGCGSNGFYVRPEYRGVGLKMFRELEQWGVDRGVIGGRLTCIPDMVDVFKKLGFKPIEVLMIKKYER